MRRIIGILKLSGGLILQVLVVLSVTFIVSGGSASPGDGDLHVFYRFVRYLGSLLTFSLGTTTNNVSVEFFIGPAVGRSVAVLVPPLVIASALSFLLQRRSCVANRPHQLRGTAESVLTLGYSIPIPFVAVLLFAFAGATGWFPLGMTASVGHSELGPIGRVLDLLHHLVLPWLTLGVFPFLLVHSSLTARMRRLEAGPLVTAGQARGLSRKRIFSSHLRKPILSELFEQLGAGMPLLVTYLAIVESVFRYPGLGFYLLRAFTRFSWAPRDAVMVAQAALVYLAIFSVLTQFFLRVLVLLLVPQLRGGMREESDRRSLQLLVLAIGSVILGAVIRLLPEAGLDGLDTATLRWIAVGLVLLFLSVLAARTRGTIASPLLPAGRLRGRYGARFKTSAGELRQFFIHNAVAIRWLLISGGLLSALMIAAWVSPVPEPLSRMILVNPQAAPIGPRLTWSAHGSLMVMRSVTHVVVVAITGTAIGFLASVVQAESRPPFLDRTAGAVALFPTLVLVVLVLQTVGGFSAFALSFLLIAFLRSFAVFRDPVRLLHQQQFVAYSQLLGRRLLWQVRWHYLPNLAPRLASTVLLVSADLIVLKANLRFVGVSVSRFVSPVVADGPDPGLFERFAANLYRPSWGAAVRSAVGDFVRGYYLPVVFPLLMLLLTVVLLRTASIMTNRLERV